MLRLGVNIDHVATLRQARGGREPDPVWAAVLAELGGADVITIHLREDRRHIQDRDVRVLKETCRVRLNLEIALDPGVLAIATEIRPGQATFVPERRQERTTEGGLDAVADLARLADAVGRCKDAGIEVALFLDADLAQVDAAVRLGVHAVEFHTGRYADAATPQEMEAELEALRRAARATVDAGLELHAGHGLNYQNVAPIAGIESMRELNIGHAIVSRAVSIGMTQAVREMKQAMELALR